MHSVLAHTPDQLRAQFAQQGLEPFRAGQVLRWIYARGVRSFDQMTDLSHELRAELRESWRSAVLEQVQSVAAADGTRKLVLQTDDGARVETVIIPEGARRTVCLSSQIGCSLDCSFCATGQLGLTRNLRSEEIVDQFLHAADTIRPAGERPTHVVFMGMGEPLLNFDHVIQAIRILTDPAAIGLSPRRLTVSTSGVIPRMGELGRTVSVRLAVSLHATTDAVRDQLVPLNRRFPISALIEACRSYPASRRDPISFEYVLIRELNDTLADARRLVRLLHGLRVKVNLIPLNEHAGTRHQRPAAGQVEQFAAVLAASGLVVSVRESRGGDILAACGQLGAVAPADPRASCARGIR